MYLNSAHSGVILHVVAESIPEEILRLRFAPRRMTTFPVILREVAGSLLVTWLSNDR